MTFSLKPWQLAFIAFLGGGILVLVVVLLVSGSGENDPQATGLTPTPTQTPREKVASRTPMTTRGFTWKSEFSPQDPW